MRFLIKLFRLDKQILTELVRDLFNTIDEYDIIREEDGKWFIGDKEIQEAEKSMIISEAQLFVKGKLWKVLQRDIKYIANKRMFINSRTEMDLVAGKLLLYLLDIINTRLQSLDKGRGIFNQHPK